MKVRPFTRTGDDGTTATARSRVRKDSDLIEALGSIDELVAYIGLARVYSKDVQDIFETLTGIQKTLFRFSASLLEIKGYEITENDIVWLEKQCLNYDANLSTLSRFVLPGGCQLGATLHIARTICRRAERRVVKLDDSMASRTHHTAFLNRLSSLFFVLARYANRSNGVGDESV